MATKSVCITTKWTRTQALFIIGNTQALIQPWIDCLCEVAISFFSLSLLSANVDGFYLQNFHMNTQLFTIVSFAHIRSFLSAHEIEVQQFIFRMNKCKQFSKRFLFLTKHCNFFLCNYNRMFSFSSQINDTIIVLLFRFYVTRDFNQFHTPSTWFLLLIMHIMMTQFLFVLWAIWELYSKSKTISELNKTEHSSSWRFEALFFPVTVD